MYVYVTVCVYLCAYVHLYICALAGVRVLNRGCTRVCVGVSACLNVRKCECTSTCVCLCVCVLEVKGECSQFRVSLCIVRLFPHASPITCYT